jgi:hypothetical protein
MEIFIFVFLVATGYWLAVKSMLNVGIRQPYPGIIKLFLIGFLVAHLRHAKVKA